MHRKNILSLLQKYTPPTLEEIAFKNRTLSFVEQNPRCFERSLEIGHLTASAWLLNKTGTKALLMHHAKLDAWLQPGGHADGESDLLQVALKEAREESGLSSIFPVQEEVFDLDVHWISKNDHFHYDVRFLLQTKEDEDAIVQNHESKALLWVGKNERELPTSDPSVLRLFKKWLLL